MLDYESKRNQDTSKYRFEQIKGSGPFPKMRETQISFCFIITIILTLALSIHSQYINSSQSDALKQLQDQISEKENIQQNINKEIQTVKTISQTVSEVEKQIQNIQYQIREKDINQEYINKEIQNVKSLPLIVSNQRMEIENLKNNADQIKNRVTELEKLIQTIQQQIREKDIIQEYVNKEISNIKILTETVTNQRMTIESIKNNADKIDSIQNRITELESKQPSANYFEKNSQAILEATNKIQKIETDIDLIKKVQENVPAKSDLKLIESDLQKSIQLTNLQVQQLSSDVLIIKDAQKVISSANQATSTQQSTNSTQIPINRTYQTQIEHYGPFGDTNGQQIIHIIEKEFGYFETTKPCNITFKGKAVVTLIATGIGQCAQYCHGQVFFLKDRILDLQQVGINGEVRQYPGAGYLNDSYYPIYLTQEFYIDEAGTHEFTLAVNLAHDTNRTFLLQALSFVAKVMYYD